MDEIPLTVLIIDPEPATAEILRRALQKIKIVVKVQSVESFETAIRVVDNEQINAIFIDPISFDIDSASEFIFDIRERNPIIAFVLYWDADRAQSQSDKLYSGKRERFRHYFKLNKLTPTSDFEEEVRESVVDCQVDLSPKIANEKIRKAQKELGEIQEGAASNSSKLIPVPAILLKEIKELLSAWQEDTSPNTPAEFLGPLPSRIDYDRCFVVMPYSHSWSVAVETVLKDTCNAEGYDFTIAKQMDGRFIARDIWHGIAGAGIIVADLTAGNANVSYEIGLADAIGREVVLICQDSTVPFDFLGHRLIIYENSVSGALELRRQLSERLRMIKKRRNQAA